MKTETDATLEAVPTEQLRKVLHQSSVPVLIRRGKGYAQRFPSRNKGYQATLPDMTHDPSSRTRNICWRRRYAARRQGLSLCRPLGRYWSAWLELSRCWSRLLKIPVPAEYLPRPSELDRRLTKPEP
jgi:hypothetical protein